MKTNVICFFVSLITLCVTLSTDEKYNQIFSAVWKELDANTDGALTVTEIEKGLVADYDTDHSGSVSQDEFLSVFNQQEEAAKLIFKQIDTNNDNAWTRDDFTALIASMDVNGDGKVTQTEFMAAGIKLFKAAKFDPDQLVIVG